MNARELKQVFVDFFISKNHIEIPSSSLIPENDPSTLFISAGMHPLVPYLLGQPHPLGKRIVNVQKCLRTGDIDEVGDTFHHTFFEMLGNWSFGDYFKKESIPWSFEFLTKHLGIFPKNLHVTIFAGDKNISLDNDSCELWLKEGILPEHIHALGVEDNWWGPAGTTGPCGPDTEIFFDTQYGKPDIDFKEGCRQGRYIEIWNNVFMQFNKTTSGEFIPLVILPFLAEFVLKILPFRYTLSFPLEILIGRSTNYDIYTGFIIGGIWLIALYFIYKILYSIAVRKYAAEGI